MGFDFVETKTAQQADGLRMVVIGGVPSPWGEAAKGLFHVKGIEWLAVRLDPGDPEQMEWTKQESAPVVFWETDPPVDQAADIVHLVERLDPNPCLLPPEHASQIIEIVTALAGRDGLGWHRRLQQVQTVLEGGAGFHPKVAAYLAEKYGHTPENGAAAGAQVILHLRALSQQLAKNGGEFLVGQNLSAADIYCATFMALFAPLPDVLCPMKPGTRLAFSSMDDATNAALDPALIALRDRVYQGWLQLPLAL